MKATGCVQECGCIALPEEIQLKTGLYPGAKFQLELTPEGNLLLVPLEPRSDSAPKLGAMCGRDSNPANSLWTRRVR